MKYASVVIPLVVVGVLFLGGCVWVAMRARNDDGDEESVGEPEPVLARPKELIEPPTRAHTVERPANIAPVSLPPSQSQASTSETPPPPRYER